MKTHWGFDTSARDLTTRPQDDFYRHAAGGWLDKNPIPKNESRWGSFMMLRFDTDKKLKNIFTELLALKKVTKGTSEQLIRDFYRSGMDMKTRNAQGLKPIAPLLKSVDAITSHSDLHKLIPELHTAGVGVFFGAAVDQDSKDSTKYILHMYQDGLGLPDRDYYLKDDAESKRIYNAYLPYVEGLFRLMGRKDTKVAQEAVLRIETELAKVSMSKEDRRDADKTYHKKNIAALTKLAPYNWDMYFKEMGARNPKNVIVMQPDFYTAVSKLLKSASLEDLKTYIAFHIVNDYAGYLSSKIVTHQFSFYGEVLQGLKEMKPLWRRTLNAVNGSLGEQIGKLYVQMYFPKEAKRKMDLLVDDLFEAYEARLKSLDWMSPATKKKALKKLRAMNRKIGYPTKWKSYKGLEIRPDDYAGNAMRSARFEHRREMRKLGKSIDRGEWFMYPQTVNAYFAPNLNDIVFPAAILQPPFFDLNADDAVNYGSIGSVIGHEITHGFDDQGSKYDEKGNLKSWWTKADRARFEKYAKIIEEQYNSYTVADGVKVNGKLTLGENIADLGGIAIAYDAYQRRLKKTGRKDIDGLTPEQRYFLGVSLFERENTRPEFEKMAVLTDPHSPSKFRINGPLANMQAFYDAYGVSKGDKLYREPKVRTTVW